MPTILNKKNDKNKKKINRNTFTTLPFHKKTHTFLQQYCPSTIRSANCSVGANETHKCVLTYQPQTCHGVRQIIESHNLRENTSGVIQKDLTKWMDDLCKYDK